MALRTQPTAPHGVVYDLAHMDGLNHLQVGDRIHDLDNLYVVDLSFFVSSTAVNPTLTIIANALRVAARLGATDQAEAQPLVTAHA